MLMKDELSKFNTYRVSKYFDYIDLGYGNQFNYYFPQVFMQMGLLPKNIIRDPHLLKHTLILNLFPTDDKNLEIFHEMEDHSSIPEEIREKYGIRKEPSAVPGNTISDQIKSTINAFQNQVLTDQNNLTNLSFVKVKEIKRKKKRKLRKLKKKLKSKSFRRELKDIKKLIKIMKKESLHTRKKIKYSSSQNIKNKLKKFKHKILPIIIQKQKTKSKRAKQLSHINSGIFFELKKQNKKPKNSNSSIIRDNKGTVTVSEYLKDKKIKGRARINNYNWALIGFTKLNYK